jgi:hypothetical protein
MAIAFVWGVVVGVRTLGVTSTPTRELVVGVPNPPSLVVEWRELAVLNPSSPGSLVPVINRLAALTNRPTLDTFVNGKASLVSRFLNGAADEFTIAFYPADKGAYHYVLLAKLRPLVRLSVSPFVAFRPSGVRYRGFRIARLTDEPSEGHVAFSGRLAVVSDSRATLERTLDGVRDGSGGFLLRTPSPEGKRRLTRLQDQSAERVASFYVRPRSAAALSVDEYYGEVRREGDAWDADVWVRASAPTPPPDDILAARTLALRTPTSGRLTLWHSALSWKWLARNVVAPLGLSWSNEAETSDVSEDDIHLPTAFAVGEGSSKVLPELVALFAMRNAGRLLDELRRGRIPVRVDGGRVTFRRREDVSVPVYIATVPVTSDIEYKAGIASLPDAFVVGSSPEFAERAVGRPARTFASMIPDTPNVADLFYLRSRPASLADDAKRTAELVRLAARFDGTPARIASAESFAKWVEGFPLFDAFDVDGLSTPDGYRLFIRATLTAQGGN